MATAEPLKRMVRPAALSLALWCGLSAGCVELNAFVAPGQAPTGAPHQIVASWEKRVMWTPDTEHGGKQIPALAGRLYLFGEQVGYPVVADGAVEVDMYDDRPATQGGTSVLVERWLIDEPTLRRLKRKDFLGYGYTLILPSKTVEDHPDLNAVHLTVKFTPRSGTPLFDPGRPIVLSMGDVPVGVPLAKAPAPAAQAVAQQPPVLPQQPPVQPVAYQPPPVVPVQSVPPTQPTVVPPPPPQPPVVMPPPQPSGMVLPPPIIMRPAPGTEVVAPSNPPALVQPPADSQGPPLRVRITVDKSGRD
jgi:hypothetical protein